MKKKDVYSMTSFQWTAPINNETDPGTGQDMLHSRTPVNWELAGLSMVPL